ncbi:MAG: hypothetical protein M1812_005059 [Candelaria pacifica]|nr:MAG: hypothetical protein M1812_005059 [Candelaria pacifica]
MRSSAVLSILFAAGALSSPLLMRELKRDILEDLTVVTITKYVEAGQTIDATTSSTAAPSVTVDAADAASSSAASSGNQYGYGHRKGQGHRHGSTTSDSTTTATTTSDAQSSSTPSSTGSSTTASSSVVAQDASSTASTTTSTTPSITPTSTTPSVTLTSVTPSSTASSTSSAAAAPAGYGSDYQSKALNAHNLHRANHSASALTWSSDLASTAAKIASSCNYAHNTEMDGGGYGQNIAAGIETDNVHQIITNLFYNGEFDYYGNMWGQDNPDMSNFEKWGHLTQVLWQGTTQLGCATQKCDTLANTGPDIPPYFTVCNYKDPGNYAGEYHNVGAPLGNPYASVS